MHFDGSRRLSTFLAERNPLLEPIRSDPRFKELMAGVRRRWEPFPPVVLPA